MEPDTGAFHNHTYAKEKKRNAEKIIAKTPG